MLNIQYSRCSLVIISIILIVQLSYGQSDSLMTQVYFPSNQTLITETSANDLKSFIYNYKGRHKVTIIGRGDRGGDHALNDSLSHNRAKSVRAFLLKNGFPTEKIGLVGGLGKRNPIEPESPYTDSLNRVVSISAPIEQVQVDIKTEIKEATRKISAYALRDSLVTVFSPYPTKYLRLYPSPRKGDTLRIDTTFTQIEERLFIARTLYIADDTTKLINSFVRKEIPRKTKKTALVGAFMDTLHSSVPGQSIIIRDLTFEFGYHVMPRTNLPALQAVSTALEKMPRLQLEIRGHVCCSDFGTDAFDNQTSQYNLSINRAKEIYDYLVINGIDEERISYAGYGMQEPIVYPEKDKNDQYSNRRIEFFILAK